MQFPILYRNLLKGRELNTKTFLIWFWQSIYQAALIMVLGVYWFSNSFTNIVTITFTCLILSEYLNILSTVHRIHPVMWGSLTLSAGVYFLSIYTMHEYISVGIIDAKFMIKIIVVVCCCWAPFILVKTIRRRLSPTQEQKIGND
eukprot:TRINITY_DN3124_c0_g1_i1.p3 TRINITY_DN3124_c0_g1~~TRINITY_DN3124_c0_g1_i1.p3  ORF type:complete len:145 (+),score=33.10 TRINITY_DN3124_c0_g1_i1:408-842(+)